MTQVQRFISVGRGVLHHYFLSVGWLKTKFCIGIVRLQYSCPKTIGNCQVEKTLDDIIPAE